MKIQYEKGLEIVPFFIILNYQFKINELKNGNYDYRNVFRYGYGSRDTGGCGYG